MCDCAAYNKATILGSGGGNNAEALKASQRQQTGDAKMGNKNTAQTKTEKGNATLMAYSKMEYGNGTQES